MAVPNDVTGPEWTRPGVYPVAPGVFRIPLPLPNDALRAVNVYAVLDESDGLTMIDAGWALAEARTALERALADLGHGLRDVRRFLVTHVHRDHYSQAVALRREFGTPVHLGIEERPSVEAYVNRTEAPMAPQVDALRRLGATEYADDLAAFAARRRSGLTWEHPDGWLTEGPIELPGRELHALHTPGHTRGHLVFAEHAAGLLFAGDHVLPHITPSIGFEPAPAERPLLSYLGSLRVVRALPDLRLLPAHGPVADSTHARIDELLAHHRRRLDACAEAVERGCSLAPEVAARLAWTSRGRALSDLDPFNRMLAVLETAAHLDVLVSQGVLAVAQVDGVLSYRY
jgi:glyoxylase-like metal-dependent hydrolase (beta-lactamase superfamily II)